MMSGVRGSGRGEGSRLGRRSRLEVGSRLEGGPVFEFFEASSLMLNSECPMTLSELDCAQICSNVLRGARRCTNQFQNIFCVKVIVRAEERPRARVWNRVGVDVTLSVRVTSGNSHPGLFQGGATRWEPASRLSSAPGSPFQRAKIFLSWLRKARLRILH